MLFHEFGILVAYNIFFSCRNGSELKEAENASDRRGYRGQHAVRLLVISTLLLPYIFNEHIYENRVVEIEQRI